MSSSVASAGAVLTTESVAVAAEKEPTRVRKAAEAAHARLDALLEEKGVSFGDDVFLRAFKEEAQLELWMKKDEAFVLVKTYSICAASGELGPKQKVGDEQVPEGFYGFGAGAMNPQSSYHLSFNVGYPNKLDKQLGRTGSLIMIHGDCVSVGCMAMTDEGIQEIYSLADAAHDAGQTKIDVHVFPFRMTKKKLAAHAKSEWAEFWGNLKEGYDAFQKDRVPPRVSVKKKRYVIQSGKAE